VHTVHGFAFPAAKSLAARMLYQTAERVCRSRTDALICLNESDRSIAEHQLRFSANQLHIVGNGVDTEHLRPASEAERTAARELLGCTNGRFAVSMVGRLWPQKDPLCFVETADLLIRQGVNADFFLIGDGELRDSLEAEIKQRGMVDRIKILGWRDDVPQLLRALDVFVLTSRWEGMPLVLLEALACGVPVVASDIAGNRDAVEHGRTGLLADVGSPKSFAENVARLLTDHTLRHNFQVAARESAERRFSLTTTVAQVRSLYRSLLEKASGRRSANRIDATPGIQTAARATSTSG
jgi:glycosyltransferase involved in cell wall biosynthesis